MTEHLPECHLWLEPTLSEQDWCICDRLRKARDRGYSEAMDDGWGEPGHIKAAVAETIEAAWETVNSVPAIGMTIGDSGNPRYEKPWMRKEDALAAIDSLKEES